MAGHAIRNTLAFAAATGIATLLVLGLPAGASAATVTTTTTDGLQYQADDANVAAGASVTGYVGIATTLAIPANVTIGPTTYAVTSIADSTSFFPGGATVSGSFSSLTIPDSVTDIGSFAFANDTSLTSVHFGAAVVKIHDGAFQGDPLGQIVLPTTMNYIGAFVFEGAAITSLVLPDGLTDIEGRAFDNEASLTTVTLPASLNALNSDAFNGDPELASVLFQGAVPAFVTPAGSPDGQSFDPSGGLVISYLWAHDAAQQPGGFTSPTWMGYNTRELATVSANLDGHGTAIAPQRVAVGSAASEPTAPNATGLAFTGWFTSPALTTRVDFSDPITADTTIYAGWASLATTGVQIGPLVPGGAAVVILLGLIAVLASRRRTV